MAASDQGDLMDQVLHSLKWWGPYQRVQFLVAILPVVTCALHIMSIVFIGREIEHSCTAVDRLNVTLQQDGVSYREYDVIRNTEQMNLTVTFGKCNIHIQNGTDLLFETRCNSGFQYEEPIDSSIVSEWDLTCERESLSDVSQTVLSLGMVTGAFGFSALSDKFGRKPSYIFAHLALFVVAIIIAFSPSFTIFLILRFLLGALQQGTGLVSTVLLLELLPKDRRALPSQVGCFVWVLALMMLCLIGYLTRDTSWRNMELVLAACSFYILFQWWITDESVRWLVANKKYLEAERTLRKAARANDVDVEKILSIFRQIQKSDPAQDVSMSTFSSSNVLPPSEVGTAQVDTADSPNSLAKNGVVAASSISTSQEEVRLSTFVKNKLVLMITAINSYIWITDSLAYYGLLLSSSSLTDNLYLGVFLSVVVELPSAFVITVALSRYGRKPVLIISHIGGAVSLLAANVLSNVPGTEHIPGINIIVLCVALLGKFSVSTAFGVVWQYTPEMYPTNLRNTSLGIASLAARIGGMLAPYSRTFGRHVPWGPGVVFALMCLVVPVLVSFLPETFGHEMPQTMSDVEQLIHHEKSRRTSKKKQSV